MTKAEPQSGQTLSTSMFYMWRCVIALAHADGKVDEAERAYLEKIFQGMDRAFGLTAEQKKIFGEDLRRPQDIAVLLSHVNDPAARGQLIYFGGLLAYADGNLSPQEDAVLKKLRADRMAALDMEKIRAEVKKAVGEQMWKHDLLAGQIRPQSRLGALIDNLLLRLGMDVFSE